MPCLPFSTVLRHVRERLWKDNMPDDLSKSTLYFGYGSNLWQHQMAQRCPTSKFLGIARLSGYRWIIYERGYANIVEIDDDDDGEDDDDDDDDAEAMHKYKNEVWGLVYRLEASDERRLDVNEGVPIAYTKEDIEVEFWAKSEKEDIITTINSRKKGKKMDMLVYINRKLDEPGKSKHEYIHRMNMGIKDAVREGVPQAYVDQVIRKYIPNEKTEQG